MLDADVLFGRVFAQSYVFFQNVNVPFEFRGCGLERMSDIVAMSFSLDAMFRKIAVVLAAAAVTANASAQTAVQKFAASMSGKCVKFHYSFVTASKVPVKGEGDARVQGNSFVTTFGGVSIYCDGVTRWTADNEAREVIVEPVNDGSGLSVSIDPAVIVGDVDRHFRVTSSVRVSEGGMALEKVSLLPLDSSMGISGMTIWFTASSAPVPVKASVKAKDGTVTDFTIPSMAFSAEMPMSSFRFGDKSGDASWVVTDLR